MRYALNRDYWIIAAGFASGLLLIWCFVFRPKHDIVASSADHGKFWSNELVVAYALTQGVTWPLWVGIYILVGLVMLVIAACAVLGQLLPKPPDPKRKSQFLFGDDND